MNMGGRREDAVPAFIDALEHDTDRIDITVDVEETTRVAPQDLIASLVVDATPPPSELPRPMSRETLTFADRVRFVLRYQEGMSAEKIEDVIRRARNLMPR